MTKKKDKIHELRSDFVEFNKKFKSHRKLLAN